MSKLLSALGNVAYTQNGALSNKSTGSRVLDFFGKSGAMRTASNEVIINAFNAAYSEDATLALKALFYARDARGGQGERRLFRVITSYLANQNPDVLRPLLPYFAEYGRWDDLLELALTPLEGDVFALLRKQFQNDIFNDLKGLKVSVLAKWLPSENASNKARKLLARRFAKYCDMGAKEYRKQLSALRQTIDVVERKMCSKKFTLINYEQVPSKASLIYRGAFEKHDPDGYTHFKAKVKKGEAKINASTLYPYEVIRPIFGGGMSKLGGKYYVNTNDNANDTLDLLWNALPNYMEGKSDNGIVVADVSGSMNGLPIMVSISLAIYIAERNTGPFKDHFLTFSEKPTLQKVQGNNIVEKVNNLAAADWGMNTNLQAVFDLVLGRAKANNLPDSELPRTIYIISDMQFDVACRGNQKTNLEVIREKYNTAGYSMPQLVFWNVNGSSDVPINVNDAGVKLVSGCSPSILVQLLSGKSVTPYDLMMETLNSERYEVIRAY